MLQELNKEAAANQLTPCRADRSVTVADRANA
jgi:hypothetical protein